MRTTPASVLPSASFIAAKVVALGWSVVASSTNVSSELNTLTPWIALSTAFRCTHDGGVVNLQCQCCHNLSTLFLCDKGTDLSVFMPQEHPHLIKIKHFRKSCSSLLSLLADIGKTTKTTSTTYNNQWAQTILLQGKQQNTTFCASFFRKSCPSLLRLLADIGKTTWTTSTTYNNLCLRQSCWKGNNKIQQRVQFALSISC